MKEKDKLLSKFVKKDYNNLLEELLATKEYDEIVKSLILSMCYKIETAYKDYKKVKENVLSKEEYMMNIFFSIQKSCEKINIIKKGDIKQGEIGCIVNREDKLIECYPIERTLLFCLADIVKKDNIVKFENQIIKEALTKMLNNGNSINMCEPLRDFNGFSWNVLIKEIEDLTYNLVYQDLICIVGIDLLEEWINKNKFVINYLESFQNKIDEDYGKNLGLEIVSNLIKIAILEDALLDEEFMEKAEEEKINNESQFFKFQNSSQYIIELGNEKKEINKKIRKLDQIINDKDLLYMEYERRNEQLPLEKKIFSMKVLKKILQEERAELLKQTEKCGNLMNPQVFLKQYEEIKKIREYFSVLNNQDLKRELANCVIELQKNVLNIFKIKIEKAQDRNEIIKLIYELRYYIQIPVSDKKRIYQVKQLESSIYEIEEILIEKAIENKVIYEISEIQRINTEVIKNIFISKSISIESIEINIYKEQEIWKVDFFDEDVLESTIQIQEFFEKKNLKVKNKKKIKLFL